MVVQGSVTNIGKKFHKKKRPNFRFVKMRFFLNFAKRSKSITLCSLIRDQSTL